MVIRGAKQIYNTLKDTLYFDKEVLFNSSCIGTITATLFEVFKCSNEIIQKQPPNMTLDDIVGDIFIGGVVGVLAYTRMSTNRLVKLVGSQDTIFHKLQNFVMRSKKNPIPLLYKIGGAALGLVLAIKTCTKPDVLLDAWNNIEHEKIILDAKQYAMQQVSLIAHTYRYIFSHIAYPIAFGFFGGNLYHSTHKKNKRYMALAVNEARENVTKGKISEELFDKFISEFPDKALDHIIYRLSINDLESSLTIYNRYLELDKSDESIYRSSRFRFAKLKHIADKETLGSYKEVKPDTEKTFEHLLELYFLYSFSQLENAETRRDELLESMVTNSRGDLGKNLALTLLFHETKDNRLQNQLQKSANLIFSDEKYLEEQIGETTNKVYTVSNTRFIKGAFVFKELFSEVDIISEIKLRDEIESIIEGNEFGIVKSYGYVKKEDKYVYVMRRSEGKKLFEILEANDKNSFKYLEKTARFLAQIHSKISTEGLEKESIAYKTRSKLHASNFDVQKELSDTILQNYRPLFNLFENAIYGINKDAHPENWLVEKERITCLDTGKWNLVPLQFDLVNLLEYGKYLKWGEKKDIIKNYILEYNKHAEENITDVRNFELTYLAGVVHRSISLCSAWSSVGRPSMHPRRALIIDNGLEAMDIMKRDYAYFYEDNKTQLTNLYSGLIRLKDKFSV